MSLRGLRANLLRSLLATLGVIIGVGAVISAMSILEGTQRDLRQRFESLGSETLMVTPAVARQGGRAGGLVQTMTVEDAEALRDRQRCPSIKAAAPEVLGGATIKRQSRNTEATVLATNEAYADMFSYRVAPHQGRFITRDDVISEQKVVVLGHRVAQQLFGNLPAVGSSVRVKGIPFRVVGVMEKKGNIGFRNVDMQVYIPISTGMNRVFGVKRITAINVRVNGPERLDQASAEIKRELRRRHNIKLRQGAKDDFNIISQEEMRKQFGDFTKIMGFVLYSIAGISLVVGGIGIMNIMLVSVTERTREIGVRMAVGARRWDILEQFLIEAGVISLLGGAVGVGAGYAFTDLLETITQQLVITYTTQWVVMYALAMAIGIGVLSGLYPAFKASRLDPVEALRYE
ncbi:MAG: ABC transporter permease [Phycisphaerae bacterium]